MAQTAFAFDLPALPPAVPPAVPPLVPPASAAEAAPSPSAHSAPTPPRWDQDFSTGFEIGRDHARHGVVPPAAQLLPGHPVRQGWALAQPAFAGRTRRADAAVRMWLQLRLRAWEQRREFDTFQLTPHHLRQLAVTRCPVTRQPLSLAEAHLVRLAPEAGYAAGQLAALSPLAARARAGLDLAQAQARAAQAATAPDGRLEGLHAAEWARLASLLSLVTPLAQADAATVPLAALPSNRLQLVNPLQGLQALATLQLAQPDWGQRVARLADALPHAALRKAFHLWLHRMLPRVWAGGRPVTPVQWRERLEDAAIDTRVQAAWQRLAALMDPAQVQALLDQVSALRLPGWKVLTHAAAQETQSGHGSARTRH